MFFSNRIISIKENHNVLEIGPGSTPYHRSDILLELKYENDEEEQFQFGNTGPLVTEKKVIYYDGREFPFKDKSFDYVICSHVIEHVNDISFFLSEMFRVAKAGYLEYPLIYYDYLYNIPAHVNFLKFKNNTLSYMKKVNSNLHQFNDIQMLFHECLAKGNNIINTSILEYIIEGFEWDAPFEINETNDLNSLTHSKEKVMNPFDRNRFLSTQISISDLLNILRIKLSNRINS